MRETFEETGIRVILERLLLPLRIKLRNETKMVIVWIARQQIPGSIPSWTGAGSEVADARWFKLTELPPIVRGRASPGTS